MPTTASDGQIYGISHTNLWAYGNEPRTQNGMRHKNVLIGEGYELRTKENA